MKRKLFRSAAVLCIATVFLVSCVNTESDHSGFGDAYILVEIVGQDTLKGLGLHAFSYSEFSSVNVHPAENPDQVYVLQPYMGYHQDFIWSTPRNQYSAEMPATGDYVFNATFKDGRTQVFFDRLYSTLVLPATITRCEYVSTTNVIEVYWDRVLNADSYNVKLLSEDGDILFVSPVFNSFTDYYSFGRNSQGWQTTSYPATGQQVVVEVSSYLLEPGGVSADLQSVGKSRYNIVWGN